jgi:hypothetical protein
MGVPPQYLKQLLAQRGARLEVTEPFLFGKTGRYMCLAKVVGIPPRVTGLISPERREGPEVPEDTQTLCVVSESGDTPEEAYAALVDRIASVHRLPSAPPPPRARPRKGWLGRLIAAFAASDRDEPG